VCDYLLTKPSDASAPATPEGITIQPILEQNQSIQCSIPRSLTISLPWHNFVDFWSLTYTSPTLSQATLPAASPIQVYSPDWASLLSQPYDVDFFHDMFSPVPWGQLEPPLSTGIDFRDFGSEDNKAVNLAPLRNEVTKYFGIKAARADTDDKKTLERHLRPFVIERQPEETQRAVQDLMDPSSTASMQILMSYMALLLSNDLVMDDAIQAFLVRAKELHQLGNLKPLFAQGSPSARAVATRLLHAAIHINATKFLRQALKSGADLESPSTGEESLTLLQEALKSGKDEAARILIDAGANVNAGASARRSKKACTAREYHVKSFTCDCKIRGPKSPIALAAQSSACVNLIPELMGKGAIIPKRNPVLLHAIIQKASVDTLSCLISAGADINQCSLVGWWEQVTPLSAAAKRVNLQVVRLLLDAGANPNGPLKPEHSKLFTGYVPLSGRSQSPLLCALKEEYNHEDDSCDVVRLLLEFGADPNISALDVILERHPLLSSEEIYELYERYDKEESFLLYPLQAAAKLDNIELVKLLLQHKASVNSAYGTPALAVAVSQSSIETVRLLFSQNADPNGLGKQYYCRSALEAAVEKENLELIDLLLESGADVNQCSASYGGRTPLQRAAENGQERVIEHLLKHGASMLSQPAPTQGASVLQGFIQNRLHKYVAKALKAGASPNGDSKDGRSPLAAAAINNDTVSLHLLLAAGAKVHEYASADFPDYRDEDTPDEDFDLFGFMKLSPIQWAAAMNYVEVARILCEAGANVNQPPCKSEGDMALHLAVRRRNYEMAKFLIAQKAEVDAYSIANTALIAAIKVDSDSMLRLLLRNGADPNQPGFSNSDESDSLSPLDQACGRGNVSGVRILLRAGADMSRGCALGSIFSGRKVSSDCGEEILEILLKYGADVNKRHYDNDTPLQKAIMEEEFDCAYRLIEAGACINDSASKGERGLTALQAAVSVGNVDMVEHLLLRGADVNAPAAVANGVTALQAATIKGYLRIAQILLEHGADIDAKAGIENGRTAIEGAAEFGRIDMVKLLLDNYQGPKLIPQMRDFAYKAAEKGNQWPVMDFLTAYEHPGEAWP
jgi:ankyrin repeat protein